MGLARHAGLPVIVVGDIDRGGVFAALYGTLALLDAGGPGAGRRVRDQQVPGRRRAAAAGPGHAPASPAGPTYGVLPWHRTSGSTPRTRSPTAGSLGRPGRRRPAGSGCGSRSSACPASPTSPTSRRSPPSRRRGAAHRRPAELADADLVVLPGRKSTVDDLGWLRETGLADAVAAPTPRPGRPLLGICGGFQMLAEPSTTRWRAGRAGSPGSGCCRSRSLRAAEDARPVDGTALGDARCGATRSITGTWSRPTRACAAADATDGRTRVPWSAASSARTGTARSSPTSSAARS